MSSRWWSPFDGMEQIAFKPVAGGFVYRAPNPWLVGPGRHYVVTEAQKAALAVHHRSTMRLAFWLMVAGIVLGVPVAGIFFPGHSWMTLVCAALGGLAIGFAVNMRLARKVRPLIAGLAPTSDRITQSDAFKIQVTVFSRRFVMGLAALSFVMFALAAAYPLLGSNGWNLNALIGMLLFGFGTAYWVALYVAKRKQSAT
jgi:hypothetical protein